MILFFYFFFPVEPQSIDVVFHRNLIEKMSTCKFEYDVIGKNILNKSGYDSQNSSEHINPGISTIWMDERRRREKLDSSQIPPIEKEIPEYRPNCRPTESDQFFRKGLIEKLRRIDEDPDATFNATLDISNLKAKKFNLKALLSNAAYPAESSQLNKTQLTNASFIDNPYHIGLDSTKNQIQEDSDVTMIDEEIVLSLSQRPIDLDKSFSPEEIQFLEVLRMLEENEEGGRDNDSLLAPLTQTANLPLSQLSGHLNVSQSTKSNINPLPTNDKNNENEKDDSYDSDDDLLNDFSFVMNDYSNDGNTNNKKLDNTRKPKVVDDDDDVWENSFWNNINLPQFDGANDLRTPKKQIIRKTRSTSISSPRGSISKAKLAKYTPLDVQINKSPKNSK